MIKGNYRVEAGQPIGEAFSATGWNRAQDAADIVLKNNATMNFDPNIPYKYGIVVPVEIDTSEALPAGTMIEYLAPSVESATGGLPELLYLKGKRAVVRTLYEYESQSVGPEHPFCVTTSPMKETDEYANCCISGLCFLLMNPYVGASGRKVTFPTDRDNSEAEPGKGEQADVGFGTLIERVSGYSLVSL